MSSPQNGHLPPVLPEKRSVYLHFLNARFVPRVHILCSRAYLSIYLFIFNIFIEKSLK